MAYVFLTGATGLLGRYLIKDLLTAGIPVAVLVRPSRRAGARHRVEHMMCHWDAHLGRSLPRPVVLEGDITHADLGLDARSRRWVAANCDTMLHNAASLTFQSTGPQSEPWRSNVLGTRHVLDLCRAAGIRRFHHVSTAYVCGLRQGLILETELDVGQTMSNDYEQSKVQSEKMVREAGFLDSLTVFRPAIIIGDSTSGYTTTYHGFYAPLQAISALRISMEPNETGLVGISARFAMGAQQTKNLVPVDWVSAVMAHVIVRPEQHGLTYHLTPRHPVTTRLLGDILEEVFGFYAVRLVGAGTQFEGMTEYERLFCELISVYSSYWKDDPRFDTTNTTARAPHLPCPHIDRKMLLKLARWAVQNNFNTPRPKPVDPVFDAAQALEPLCDALLGLDLPEAAQRLGLRITGHGGGDWHLLAAGDQILAADAGIDTRCMATIECDVEILAALAAGNESLDEVLARNDIKVQGEAISQRQLSRAISRLCEQNPARVVA